MSQVADTIRSEQRAYAPPQERPLGAYAGLLAAYGITSAGLLGVIWTRRAKLPRLQTGDLALLAVATFRLSRVVARDSVTSALRAPFTRYRGPSGVPSEVDEEVRGAGARKAVGELLTCPFCLGQWFATLLVASHVLAPRATRVVAGTLSIAAAADGLQLAYAAANKATE